MDATRKLTTFFIGMVFLTTSGCAALWPDQSTSQRGASSSLVDFLYPEGVTPPEKTSKARLELPLRVGIGFLPASSYHTVLSEGDREKLLQEVKQHFAERDYVQHIEIIPQTYLRGRDGVLIVEQLGRLYDLDVVGLVSYDQALVSESRKSSLLYWTILGAYVVKGNRNAVSTFVDLAVIDVHSKKLLLRAGGTHQDQKNTTLVDLSAENRKSQLDGFSQASTDLIQNFSVELDGFEESIKTNDEIEVHRRSDGVGGSGALALELCLLLLAIGCQQLRRTFIPSSKYGTDPLLSYIDIKEKR